MKISDESNKKLQKEIDTLIKYFGASTDIRTDAHQKYNNYSLDLIHVNKNLTIYI